MLVPWHLEFSRDVELLSAQLSARGQELRAAARAEWSTKGEVTPTSVQNKLFVGALLVALAASWLTPVLGTVLRYASWVNVLAALGVAEIAFLVYQRLRLVVWAGPVEFQLANSVEIAGWGTAHMRGNVSSIRSRCFPCTIPQGCWARHR